MRDLHDGNRCRAVVDLVKGPVFALTNPIPLTAGEFFRAKGARVGRKVTNLGDRSPSVLQRETLEFFGCRRLDEELIACHVA